VLLAGLGSTSRIWGDLPRLLGRRFTVICLDNRGVGGSREGQPFSVPGAVVELTAVLDHLEIDKAAILGASMGGLIALTTALEAPERTGQLVLLSCAAHLSRHGRRSLELLARLLDLFPPAEIGTALMTLAFAPPFQERFPAFVSDAAGLYGLDPDDVEGTRHQVRHLLEGWDHRPRLTNVHCPTLVLSGGRDAVVAAEDTATIAAAVPEAELVTIASAGHSVLAEGGEAVLSRVLGFLTG